MGKSRNDEAFAEAQRRIKRARRNGSTDLNLGGLGLTTVASEIASLTALQTLDLTGNQLTALPPEIGSLTALQTLDLTGNQLTALPPEIGSLTALRMLRLGNNQLTTLPPEIGSLTGLETLDLNNNRLATLPTEIGSLTDLQVLYLHGNDGLGLMPEVVGPKWQEDFGREKSASPKAILDYYFRVSTQPTTPLNEGKMILVGRGGVGKSSLVRRLQEDKFNAAQIYTEGISIEPLEMVVDSRVKVLMHVWDFGGQEILHATHRFFLTQRSLYLVVLIGRDGGEEADAEYWLKTINTLAPDSPVLVVLNKHRSYPASLDRKRLYSK